MVFEKNQQAFFVLVKAGLWEKDERLLSNEMLDYDKIFRLAEEQSVIGLVAAGLEHIVNVKPQKELVLEFVGQTLQLEQRNKAMNNFIGDIVGKMGNAGIYALLIKGQGIAQCYERPLWRASGDVDFLLSADNYKKAYSFLKPVALSVEEEDKYYRHIALNIDPWVIELHGSLRSGLWSRLDKELDKVQNAIFYGGNVRSWMNGNVQVFLPKSNEDIVLVFCHILQHFFLEGIGLRQICDWCRLLWTYRDEIDEKLLASRLKAMGIESEWKSFACLAVNTLGMPAEAMPFYSSDNRWQRKANKVLSFVMETGNFGHNRDYSYYKKYPYVVYKSISMWRHFKDGVRFFSIFPLDSMKVTERRIKKGFKLAIKGTNHE